MNSNKLPRPYWLQIPLGGREVRELWASVMGSAWESWSWWTQITYVEGDWETPGVVTITSTDPEDPAESTTTTVDLDRFMDAVQAYMNEGNAVDINNPDFDASSGDAVMQIAVLGEVVYG